MSQTTPRNDLNGNKQAPLPPGKSTQLARQSDPNGPQALEVLFEKHKDALEKTAAKHITPDRLIKVALMARSTNDYLKQCTAESFLRSVIQAGELGLEPSGQYGGAHLVPRWNSKISKWECTLVPDYRGLVELARRSGEVSHVDVGAVYSNDEFVFERGLNPKLVHRPALVGDRGECVGYWAVIFLRGGSTTFEVMRLDEVHAIRDRVKSWEKTPWKSDPDAMGKKTVIKRVMNLAPKSKEYRRALEIEEENDDVTIIHDVPALPALAASTGAIGVELRQTKSQKLASDLKQKRGLITEVQPGETEEQAEAREANEPPPPGDDQAPPEPGAEG